MIYINRILDSLRFGRWRREIAHKRYHPQYDLRKPQQKLWNTRRPNELSFYKLFCCNAMKYKKQFFFLNGIAKRKSSTAGVENNFTKLTHHTLLRWYFFKYSDTYARRFMSRPVCALTVDGAIGDCHAATAKFQLTRFHPAFATVAVLELKLAK